MTGAPVVPFAVIGTDKLQPGGAGLPRPGKSRCASARRWSSPATRAMDRDRHVLRAVTDSVTRGHAAVRPGVRGHVYREQGEGGVGPRACGNGRTDRSMSGPPSMRCDCSGGVPATEGLPSGVPATEGLPSGCRGARGPALRVARLGAVFACAGAASRARGRRVACGGAVFRPVRAFRPAQSMAVGTGATASCCGDGARQPGCGPPSGAQTRRSTGGC